MAKKHEKDREKSSLSIENSVYYTCKTFINLN